MPSPLWIPLPSLLIPLRPMFSIRRRLASPSRQFLSTYPKTADAGCLCSHPPTSVLRVSGEAHRWWCCTLPWVRRVVCLGFDFWGDSLPVHGERGSDSMAGSVLSASCAFALPQRLELESCCCFVHAQGWPRGELVFSKDAWLASDGVVKIKLTCLNI